MALETELWRVDSDRPEQLRRGELDAEKRLEDWLCRDIGLLLGLLDGQSAGAT